MAVDFIEDIYVYSKIITTLKRIADRSNYIEEGALLDEIKNCYKQLNDIIEMLEAGYKDIYFELKDAVQKTLSHNGDIFEICDLGIEIVVPVLEKIISELGTISVDVNDIYTIESSKTGYLNLYSHKINRYYHSIVDPMQEAKEFITSVFDPKYSQYVVFGCGMGYQIYQLYVQSYESVKIIVYEPHQEVANYAINYGVLGWVPSENIEIIATQDLLCFLERAQEDNTGVIFLKKTISEIDNDFEREVVVSLYMQYNTAEYQKAISCVNFYRNIEAKLPDVSVLHNPLKEEVVIVAGGPTLDDGYEILRKWKGEKTIIAVMTVFRKLIQHGIEPDYVLAMDPSPAMEKHLIGIENEKVPVILDINVFWKWTYNYNGPKYMSYTQSAFPFINEYMISNEKDVWIPGGTVTFQALEFALHFGAQKIYFMGTDMGYPGGESHSSGTAQYKLKTQDDMIEVPQVYGGKVGTDRILNFYRENIENRIRNINGDVKIYNLSTEGARIEGAEEIGRNIIPDYKEKSIFRRIRATLNNRSLSYECVLETVKRQESHLTERERIQFINHINLQHHQDKLMMLSACLEATDKQIYRIELVTVLREGIKTYLGELACNNSSKTKVVIVDSITVMDGSAEEEIKTLINEGFLVGVINISINITDLWHGLYENKDSEYRLEMLLVDDRYCPMIGVKLNDDLVECRLIQSFLNELKPCDYIIRVKDEIIKAILT